ncbi:MAG: BCCT family transporter [Halobaculum sp.]
MSTQGGNAVETVLRKLLLPVGALTGVVVVSGFFFPWIVGSVVSGQGWLVVSLLFFISALTYLSLLPLDTDAVEAESDPSSGAPYLLRVRRFSVRETLRQFLSRQDPVIFGVPVLVFAAFFLLQLFAPSATGGAVSTVQRVILTRFDWLFLGAIFLAVAYCLFLLVGPWGEIRLGGPEAEPSYTYPTYFGLFFAAGIAAGIVFWGPAEALFHYQSPPPLVDAAPKSSGAVVGALSYSLFHWGFSAWSAYLVIGLPIAYFTYQHGVPLRVSAILTPFLGPDNLDGYWGKLVDVLAIFATIGGIATSIAFVGEQFMLGINFQWGVTQGGLGPVLFVAGLSVIYVVSAQSGVQRGIRRLTAVNVALFGLFAALLFAVGPRAFVIDHGAAAVTQYATTFVSRSFHAGSEWATSWTVWNWSWWFSWAPFAGLFLAALSKGRRVRTVVLTAVVSTSLATVVWFLLMGGTALAFQESGRADVLASIASYGGSEAVAGFPVFAALPFSQLLMFLFLALIVVFIVTSADTSTLVVSILATERELSPTTGSIVFWGVLQAAVAISVLVVGGGEALQAVAVLTGGPFAVIALVALLGLTRTFLREEGGHDSLLAKLRSRTGESELKAPSEVLREDD